MNNPMSWVGDIPRDDVPKAARLRARLRSPAPLLVAGAHNSISALLVEQAGFDAIWASSFELSTSFGVPDASILTMADSLASSEAMDRVSALPVIADCDNGYGNAINVIRTVEEYERRGIAAICIEDNVFPKRCSLYPGGRRELESIAEFSGKIRAAKTAQRCPDFLVIARTEALIAGWGMEEALRRGRAYADVGADMVLIHSKSHSPDEVLTFAQAWDRPVPLVCVPTTYYEAPAELLTSAGFRVIIYANHGIRASIRAMREVLFTLKREQQAGVVEHRIASLQEIYELVGAEKITAQEAEFLPRMPESVAAGGPAAPSRDLAIGHLSVPSADIGTPEGRAAAFLAALKRNGYDFHTGVPCSLLKCLLQRMDDEPSWGYVSAVCEASAIGLGAGAYLGGRLPVIYMQNSGLGVSINALQSLSQMYALPSLLVIAWRGEGVPTDAPEHVEMGQRMKSLLDTCQIAWRVLDPQHINRDVDEMTRKLLNTERPVALIIRRGVFGT